MARLFGANGYGALAGTVALFATCAQLVGFGTGIALLRHVARDGNLPPRFAATQRIYLLSAVLLTLLATPIALLFLGDRIAPSAVICLAIAEILAAPAFMPLAYRFQAEERMFAFGATLTAPPIVRGLALVAALAFEIRDLGGFSLLYLLMLSITAIAIATWRQPVHQAPTYSELREIVGEGLPYAVSGVAVTAGSELDKTALLRLAGDAAAGEYAAAQRIVQAATMPVNSLVLALTPRMFRATAPIDTRNIERLALGVTLAYALVASAAIWVAAPLTKLVLGQDFHDSEPLLRALCLVLVSSCLRQMLVAQLTATDMQVARNWMEGGAALLSIAVLISTIPHFGAYGAIAAAFIADMGVCILAFAKLRTRLRT